MKLTSQEELTVKAYNEGAVEWEKEHSDTSYWKKEFETFKKLLPKGKVLEIGCGGGRDAKVLISMGYKYIGTDIANEFIKVAKQVVPEGKFLTRNVYNLSFDNIKFDGFWASGIFIHIPKNRIDLTLQELRRVVRPNGVGFISVKQGKGESIIDEYFAGKKRGKRFWALYDKAAFDEILRRNKMNILYFRKWAISKRTTWLIYFVKVKK